MCCRPPILYSAHGLWAGPHRPHPPLWARCYLQAGEAGCGPGQIVVPPAQGPALVGTGLGCACYSQAREPTSRPRPRPAGRSRTKISRSSSDPCTSFELPPPTAPSFDLSHARHSTSVRSLSIATPLTLPLGANRCITSTPSPFLVR